MAKKYVYSCIDRANITGTVDAVEENTPFITDKFVNLIVYTSRKEPSTVKDRINVVVNKKLLGNITEGSCVKIAGAIQTKTVNGHLYIYIFAYDITEVEAGTAMDTDQLKFEGYLCKKPVLRKTPFSNRTVCDCVLAINDRGLSYYVPCICWSKNAKKMAQSAVGDKFYVSGRLQSREYVKNEKTYVINEVSIYHIDEFSFNSEDD